ncbi:MAG: universal stress protein [Bradymonadaceae bacterium]
MKATPAQSFIQAILVATDFSDRSMKAETFAFSMAERFGATLVFVHGIEPILGTDDGDENDDFEEFYERLRVKAREQLRERVERARLQGLQARFHVEVGPRWGIILERAEVEDADMIVIGRRSYTEGGPISLGTTSQRVYFGSHRPVFIVPLEHGSTEGEDSPGGQA